MQALSRITASAWEASLQRARLVNIAVVRPTVAFAAPIWQMPSKKPKGIARQLQLIQNACHRTVTRAYQETPTRGLKTETFVPPIDIHLDGLTIKFQKRLDASGQAQAIRQACNAISWRLTGRRGPRKSRKASPGELRSHWASRWEEDAKAWIQSQAIAIP